MKINLLKIVLVLVTGLMTISLTSCSTKEEGISLVVIVGKHANSFSFTDSDYEIAKELMLRAYEYTEGYNAVGDIQIIVSDGYPQKQDILDINNNEVISLEVNANNSRTRDNYIKDSVENKIIPFVKSDVLSANDEENDLLGAIKEASLLLQSSTRTEKHILIMDTGITTSGYFNMIDIDVQNNSNDDIINALNTYEVIPDLSGINITFLGLGNVAKPQEINNPTLEKKLVQLWSNIIESANGTLVSPILYSPIGTTPMNYYESGEGYPYVSVVPFNSFTITLDGTKEMESIVSEESENNTEKEKNLYIKNIDSFIELGIEIEVQSLGFKPNTSEYRNEEVTYKNLEELASTIDKFFESNPNSKIYIIGSEATGTYGEENTGNLSVLRAEKVKKTLEEMLTLQEINSGGLIAIGTGTKLPWREEPEFNSETYTRNEEISQRNRAVWIIPDTATEKITELRNAGFIN